MSDEADYAEGKKGGKNPTYLQQMITVVMEVSVERKHILLVANPHLTVRLQDQTSVMRHHHNSTSELPNRLTQSIDLPRKR